MFLYQNRSQSIQQKIDDSYKVLASRSLSIWTLNGETEDYQACYISEFLLVVALIKERLEQGQRDFYILDVGAGLFGWGRQLAVRLTREFAEKDELKQYGPFHIHIIGVTAEGHGEELSEEILKSGRADLMKHILNSRSNIIKNILVEDMSQNTISTRVLKGTICTVYEFGHFKVENILEILPTRLSECQNQSVTNTSPLARFDFIVSNSCLHHLVDPLGIVEQMLNMLSLHGIAQFSGSRINLKNNGKLMNVTTAMMYLMNAINLRFFTGTPLYHEPTFMIQRTSSDAISLPVTYNEHENRSYQLTSNCSIDESEEFAITLETFGGGNIPNAAGLRFYLAVNKLLPKREVSSHNLSLFKNIRKLTIESWNEIFGAGPLTGPFPLVFDNQPRDLESTNYLFK